MVGNGRSGDKSAKFHQLAANTQRARRLVFAGILHKPVTPYSTLLFADCHVAKFGHQDERVLCDRKKEICHSGEHSPESIAPLVQMSDEQWHRKCEAKSCA